MPERLAEVFEAFVTTKPHGMGLGLAICRKIVERHDGQIWASSVAPHGAQLSNCAAFEQPAVR